MSVQTTALSERALARIVSSYAAMSRGDKVRTRNHLTSAAMAAVMSGNIERATRYGAVAAAIDSHRATPTTATVDHSARLSDLAATLEAAALRLRITGIAVDGVTYRATEPGTVNDADVDKLATYRTRATRSANGTVAAWIAAHVTDTPRTIAELRASADVTAYMPSTGAIGACLVRVADGTEEVDGFAVADVDGRRGAVAV